MNSLRKVSNCLYKVAEIKAAIDELCSELRKDPELYYAYQSNIAMAFVDAYNQKKSDGKYLNKEVLHEVANNAAKNFLDLFIKK